MPRRDARQHGGEAGLEIGIGEHGPSVGQVDAFVNVNLQTQVLSFPRRGE
jgi:hypothetical protein